MEEELISVVIPVKNGDVWLEGTISAILSQKIDGRVEIIIIDSGSTDNTLAILNRYPVRLVRIEPCDFNHGLTRNLGVREAKGKYIVMTVQDAKPASAYWLQHLLDGFVDDTVAGVCGMQVVPHQRDRNPAEWHRPISRPLLRKHHFHSVEDFKKLSGKEQLTICRWDDVNSMYRRDLLLQLPFRETDFAEDMLWARDALLAGLAIVYNPLAQVEHYHYQDYDFAFRRNFIAQYHIYKYFGVLPEKKNSFLNLLKTIKLLTKERKLPIAEKWKWLRYNYQYQRAVNESNDIFIKCLANGTNERLRLLYKEICESVPQALKLLTNVK